MSFVVLCSDRVVGARMSVIACHHPEAPRGQHPEGVKELLGEKGIRVGLSSVGGISGSESSDGPWHLVVL